MTNLNFVTACSKCEFCKTKDTGLMMTKRFDSLLSAHFVLIVLSTLRSVKAILYKGNRFVYLEAKISLPVYSLQICSCYLLFISDDFVLIIIREEIYDFLIHSLSSLARNNSLRCRVESANLHDLQ